MAEKSNKKFVKEAVKLAQDNVFQAMMIRTMVDFIADNGMMGFANDKYTERKLIRAYFRNIAIERLSQRGYDMGIGTPWGKEVTELVEEDLDLDLDEDNEDEEDI